MLRLRANDGGLVWSLHQWARVGPTETTVNGGKMREPGKGG